jgi:hypothetical protein
MYGMDDPNVRRAYLAAYGCSKWSEQVRVPIQAAAPHYRGLWLRHLTFPFTPPLVLSTPILPSHSFVCSGYYCFPWVSWFDPRFQVLPFVLGKPAVQALRIACDHSPLVELGAGLGHWQRALAALGADVQSFDNMSALPVPDVRTPQPEFAGKVSESPSSNLHPFPCHIDSSLPEA